MSKQKNKQQPKSKPAPKTNIPVSGVMPWKYIAILFAFGFLLYANTFNHDFAQDDAIVITDNMFTKEGIDGIPGLLKYDTFYGFFKKEGKDKLVAGGRYRPLTPVMFALEYQIFGEKPWIGHVMNAFYYGLTVVTLFLLLLKLFSRREEREAALMIALGASLLFAAHPLHTEAVANIKGRDEIIALFASLLALHLSFRAYFEKKKVLHIVAGVIFFLGLLSKENTITFLAVIPMTYYFFTKEKGNKIVLNILPFLAATVVFLALRGSILGWTLGDPPGELMNNPFLKLVGGKWVAFSAAEKLATIMFTLGKYVQLLIFPHPLTHDYYPYQVGIRNWGDPMVLGSLILYLGLIAVVILGWRKKSPVAFGVAFFLITLSIVSNIVFPVGTNMSERFMFMPSVGFAISISYLLFTLTKKAASNPYLIIIGAITLLFALKTYDRNQVWKDNFTLFTTDVQVSKNSAKLQNAAGGALSNRASTEPNEQKKNAMLNEAVGHLNEAIRIHPTYKNAFLIRGNCYNWLKQYDKAIADYTYALKLDPGYEDATKNLAITYREAGEYFGKEKGDLNQALTYLSKAYEMDPNEYATVRLMGVAYGMGGNKEKAIEYFTKCTQLEPENAFAWFDLGIAYLNAGNNELGNTYITKARTLDPEIDQKRGENR
ncbi:MAG: glycosyltransferase family 39 protein [Saprospiraceae bacterium]|nr:glycosyltransferase family 39 protein [Saprospiraceae bacterium]MCB9325451.1 glycosyltransferase family 39 protein [Lewinellaceae bacterium]